MIKISSPFRVCLAAEQNFFHLPTKPRIRHHQERKGKIGRDLFLGVVREESFNEDER